MSHKISITVAGFALVMFGNINSALAASFYKITDLGSLINSTYSYASDINNSNQVILNSGFGTSNGNPSRAFIYNNGNIKEIKPLPGDTDIAVESINNLGQVTGNSVNEVNFTGNNAFVYSDGKTQKLIGINDAIPYGINDKGEVVGGAQRIGPFLYRDGTFIELGSEGTVAYGINNQSQVVGILNTQRAFLYENGITTNLGTFPGDNYSSAEGINDKGQVVGVSARSGIDNGLAFLYSKNTGFINLGRLLPKDLFSVALDINNNGQIVGFSGSNFDFFTPTGSGISAFLYSDNKIQDLNDLIPLQSGYIITQARAINDQGQIVGSASFNGQLRAVLLTPVSNIKPVIEPNTISSLLILGASAIVFKLKRKHSRIMIKPGR